MDPRLRDRLRVLWYLALPLFPLVAVIIWIQDDSPIRESVWSTWKAICYAMRKPDPPRDLP